MLAYTRRAMWFWCRKYVAAFVLIWALADLTVPGLCQADDDRIDAPESALLVGSQETTPLILSAPTVPTSDQGGSPDECFCCSPYTSPTSVFNLHLSLNVDWSFVHGAAQTPLSLSWMPIPISLYQKERRSSPDSQPPLLVPLRC